ncbi:hypothetical protein AT727_02640 [Desulfitobacterium hafniense]|uniref:Polysaccharide pyruvyl transferase domain-containing protein n=1 Tax=Desulfitobacterium hafniense TaxID=49338 RepID=A0A0W1JRH3_DESHA|nr:polysaccharide pyruvyl transferase family protein [Desulfitobacterium hafniense]KTE93871.1 hypothetical protein AT727_02640 [Desulfitobacterium hafniense]
MKKIGVVANHRTINYGTMLQAYATQMALTQLGYKVETVNIDGLANEIYKKKLRYFNQELTKYEFFQTKYPALKKAIQEKIDPAFARNIALREGRFRKFRESSFPTSEFCADKAALTELSRTYDTVLVGSDQVWLPSNIAADILTLSFVPDDINKVAFASSFGVPELPESMRERAKNFLNRIDSVSVREKSGRKLIERLTGREVPVVCDPTLLFPAKQWADMMPPKQILDEPYIFCYFLGNNPYQRKFVKTFQKKSGLKIVSALHMDEYIKSDNNFPDYAPYDMGPEEFLNFLRHAQYIFTDSFHGAALSTLHRKEFFVFYRFREGTAFSTNTRIDSFFDLIGLKERLITTEASIENCPKIKSDFESALASIERLRLESWSYLGKALKGEFK